MSFVVEPALTAQKRLIIGLGELQVSDDPAATLITFALGSCIAVAVHDASAGVGGLLHAVLPNSEVNADQAQASPALFVDTGIPALFRACYARGARKERLRVRLVGAGTANGSGPDQFQIGKRNLLMARQLFWKNNVLVSGQDTGGSTARTLTLHVGTGIVTVRSSRGTLQL
jgi:chemotaxis protein CheD